MIKIENKSPEEIAEIGRDRKSLCRRERWNCKAPYRRTNDKSV